MATSLKNKQCFLTIADVARKFLSVPSTSLPSERVSSKLVTKARNCTSHKLVDKVMFLTK
ncbi:hypothetical protein DPMN_037580 [Dreissena polymorpha]|uniref:HAT C-terminal dimerisation domain-containing protein n=1 Tax=Dreissena polymorpha TaxID=45954 RepID=A0A9D4MCW5_DREPO|nr:hypothetical protein DPMN_037580 [Dreissena polymorpha]